ncbi:hypothetical protein BDDG_12279 [Blastomyces dermatitidis ATCC 18188]|uniref:Uncharacterized protein n=1 Tax=Ajellomyces dermatitidis (strain ATCC 18188 / CBS 674.68) TaxID=653446 RepID=A0A0J9ENW0_AJEDA|nr:hypothetical protein BDDG_12279 [Blastomyces dermatitidis ATCC 18188]
MSLKKKSTAVKMSAVSMVKKALILEKLFQLLSQKKHDTLLHMSDREEETDEETDEEKTDENEMKENNEEEDIEMNEREESQKTAVEAADNEELQVELKVEVE